ncbi:metal-sensing transcriptional repressor [Candidatus Acetothermia bacterium]|nr:metal-sensing transcriptional repressor [Candidatus Acetothermia bacterium]
MSIPTASQQEVTNRLSRIEGHLRGIKRMVEEKRTCTDILLQISAVRAAIDNVGKIILQDHLNTCIREAIKEGTGEEAVTELQEALSCFL